MTLSPRYLVGHVSRLLKLGEIVRQRRSLEVKVLGARLADQEHALLDAGAARILGGISAADMNCPLRGPGLSIGSPFG